MDLPKYKLAQQSIEPRVAYQLVQDEMLDEGNARLNLATFCQTYMEPEAVKLMSQTLEKMRLINRNIQEQLKLKTVAST
ncbi:glutamate decarboxylase [Lactococcus cremoris]|uniref:Glutamate decarboxylase n=1 Tax=Lactococcus lactis subsp. cremoris TaxID=1359 RepID=A0AAD1NGD4_LACLC|nr:glutamate decarboxylase [Lactococcus cremoris]BCO02302.1 hypothetical protein LLG32_03960 [Lactococcus cremoris]BCO05035.1 hypothetical protein LLC_02750 [Lactococcus cremoris]